MVIANAIREAETEYVVFFLLEAYLNCESRRAALKNLPAQIGAVPLTGIPDAQSRRTLLLHELDIASRRPDDVSAIQEALGVFTAAVQRLHSLDSMKSAAGARPFVHAAGGSFPKASTQA